MADTRAARVASMAIGAAARPGVAVGIGALSVLGLVLSLALNANGMRMLDLDVYIGSARYAFSPRLYTVADLVSGLPFTYPPFAAIVFLPLTVVPMSLVKVLWLLASVSALAYVVWKVLGWSGLFNRYAALPLTVSVTALAIWLQPIRTTLAYGQINIFLMALVVCGVRARRPALSGLAIGLAAGLKLLPIGTVVYQIVQRSYRAAAWTVAFFAATVVVALLVTPHNTAFYFGTLLLKPQRAGDLWSTHNQSLRGAVARLLGQENSAVWLAAVALVGALTWWALRGLVRIRDDLGCLVVVQYAILLVSPISWDHHWVWVVPCVLWGMARMAQTSRWLPGITAAFWALLGWSMVISIRIRDEESLQTVARGLGPVIVDNSYAIAGVATLVLMGLHARRLARQDGGSHVGSMCQGSSADGRVE